MAKAARFLTDRRGDRIAVVVDLKDYRKMMEQLEDLEDIRACEAAKASNEKPVPYEKVRARILRRRK